MYGTTVIDRGRKLAVGSDVRVRNVNMTGRYMRKAVPLERYVADQNLGLSFIKTDVRN